MTKPVTWAGALLALMLTLLATGVPAYATDLYTPRQAVRLTNPAWTKNAIIYQLNTRQFSKEGTLKAAQTQLPRLKALGVDIIWLMPIHEIGVKNRKGGLGSPYSVKDYYSVNPDLGTLDDLKAFTAEAHRLGLYVILDWVANHTAWDNPLTVQHPDWYERDLDGRFRPTPWWDWSDIINLSYAKPETRRYMTEAMAYWVREADIDGFRADVAGFVPLDFWETARAQLETIKPVFLLAEWEMRDVHYAAFDASYAWSWSEAMRKIVKGQADVNALFVFYSWNESAYPREAMRMIMTSNHDQNAWEGTEFEWFGPAREAAIVLSIVGEGIPLIYNGQEAGNEKRLAFFERDPIVWREHSQGALFKTLFALKHANKALWNGQWGGRMHAVVNTAPSQVLSFFRRVEEDQVFAAINFSDQARTVTFKATHHHGAYVDAFTGEAVDVDGAMAMTLPAWGYRVLVRGGGARK